MVVDAGDVRALTNRAEGWTVEQRPGVDRAGVVVAVLGVYNRGKTFLLNKVRPLAVFLSLRMCVCARMCGAWPVSVRFWGKE